MLCPKGGRAEGGYPVEVEAVQDENRGDGEVERTRRKRDDHFRVTGRVDGRRGVSECFRNDACREANFKDVVNKCGIVDESVYCMMSVKK